MSGTATAPPTPESEYARGLELLEQGKAKEAVAALVSAVNGSTTAGTKPLLCDALVALSDAHIAAGSVRKGLKRISLAVTLADEIGDGERKAAARLKQEEAMYAMAMSTAEKLEADNLLKQRAEAKRAAEAAGGAGDDDGDSSSVSSDTSSENSEEKAESKVQLLQNLREGVYCEIGVSPETGGIGAIALRPVPKGTLPFLLTCGDHSSHTRCSRSVALTTEELDSVSGPVKSLVTRLMELDEDTGTYSVPYSGPNAFTVEEYVRSGTQENANLGYTLLEGFSYYSLIAIRDIAVGEEVIVSSEGEYDKDGEFVVESSSEEGEGESDDDE